MEPKFSWFRKKPVLVQGFLLTEDLWNDVYSKKDHKIFINKYELRAGHQDSKNKCFYVNTLEDVEDGKLHKGQIGDYLLVGVQGEIYACKPDIFEQTYEKVTDVVNKEVENV